MILYHGSFAADICYLEPRSKLHGSENEKVVYLSGSIPYALVYIWDSQKTNYSRKYVTCALKEGIVHYEEMFPDQLRELYEGVSGYLYFVEQTADMKHMPKTHEDMFYCTSPVKVQKTIFIPDVYKEILHYEEEGLFKISGFNGATKEVQAERIERTAKWIEMCNFMDADLDQARFMKHYCKQAWELAERWRKEKIGGFSYGTK